MLNKHKLIQCKAKGCTNEFTPIRSTKKYCSETCRKRKDKLPRTSRPKLICTGYDAIDDRLLSAPPEEHQPCTANNGAPKERPSKGEEDSNYTCMSCRKKRAAVLSLLNIEQNWFFKRLWYESKRAGTVEIIPSMEDLSFYLDIVKKSRVFNGYTYQVQESKDVKLIRTYTYNLCHRVPVKSDDYVGLLNPENLFIGDAYENRIASNKQVYPIEIGINCLNRATLKEQYKINENCSIKSFLHILQTYMGVNELQEFVTTKSLKTYVQSINDIDNKYVPKEPAAFEQEVVEYNFFNDSTLPRDFKIEVSRIFFKAAKLVDCKELGFKGMNGALCYDIDTQQLFEAPGYISALNQYLTSKDEKDLDKAILALKKYWLN